MAAFYFMLRLCHEKIKNIVNNILPSIKLSKMKFTRDSIKKIQALTLDAKIFGFKRTPPLYKYNKVHKKSFVENIEVLGSFDMLCRSL